MGEAKRRKLAGYRPDKSRAIPKYHGPSLPYRCMRPQCGHKILLTQKGLLEHYDAVHAVAEVVPAVPSDVS